jgi:serine/threonine-protein kinase
MKQIGKYKVIKELGAGGFGAVYLATDPRLGEQVAIKVFQPQDANLASQATSASGDASQVLQQRFLSEAKTLRQLGKNQYIVDVFDFDEMANGAPYYVMPYLPCSLKDELGSDATDTSVLAELSPEQKPRPLPINKSLVILEQLLLALKDVHKAGLVHRDIKPANLLIDQHGDIKLCDFGIAKMPDTQHSQSGVGIGSRNYMSPEQRQSAKHVDARSDVYSIGVLAYRMLTGTLPEGRFADPMTYQPAIDKPFNDFIIKALEQQKDNRFADAGDMYQAFKKLSPANKNQADDNTATDIGNTTQSEIKAELKPLQNKITALLIKQGEITEADKALLQALADLADMNEEALAAFIIEVSERAQRESPELKAFIRWVIKLNQRIKTGNTDLSNAEQQVLIEAGVATTGKSADSFEALIVRKGFTEDSIGKVDTKPLTSNQESTKQNGNKSIKEVQVQIEQEIDNKGNGKLANDQTDDSKINTAKLEKKKADTPSALKAAVAVIVALTGGWFFGTEMLMPEQVEQAKQAEIEKYQGSKEYKEQDAQALITLDKDAWQKAMKTNTLSGYQLYLAAWPDGQYSIKAKLAEASKLKKEKPPALENDKLALTINTTPKDAKIIMTSIKPVYKAGMRLVPGEYTIKVSKKGFVSLTGSLILKKGQQVFSAKLEPIVQKEKTYQVAGTSFTLQEIPGGSFQMGSTNGATNEQPVRNVTIAPFRMMTTEVTWAMYQACVDAKACYGLYGVNGDKGFGRGERPVINVNHADVSTFIRWLEKQTGETFRLPSEAEWEYAARAGSSTNYSWGDSIGRNKANCYDCGSEWKGKKTAPVKSFAANAFGLYDMHGNVFELTQDCWHKNYQGAPANGNAWLSSNKGDCDKRVVRGGSWYYGSSDLRSAYRGEALSIHRDYNNGFRLVQSK